MLLGYRVILHELALLDITLLLLSIGFPAALVRLVFVNRIVDLRLLRPVSFGTNVILQIIDEEVLVLDEIKILLCRVLVLSTTHTISMFSCKE